MRFIQIALLVVFSASSALAADYSDKVIEACKDDYIKHCEGIDAGTEESKKCMRDAGKKLSEGCVTALHGDGHISDDDLAAYKDANK